MKKVFYVMMTMSLAAVMTGCGEKEQKFNYLLDEFADLKIMRYQIPGWDELSLQQKEYAYHLAEAAKWGRDIIWDQNSEHNIELRHTIENILNNYEGDKSSDEYQKFLVYAKRVFFANGIHHHYAEDKFFPECSQEYFKSLMQAVG
ncbi:MAG: dihydrofolate reductase, partial [Bacteroidaceae bacterium]|nr:dihydrofolate reductase [Bacteroidaceae bacterium]